MTNTTKTAKPAAKTAAKTASQILAANRVKAKAWEGAQQAKAIAAIVNSAHKAAGNKPLPVLRTAFVTAVMSGEGKTLAYANSLTVQFGKGWEKIKLAGPCNSNEKKIREAIKVEQGILYTMLKVKGHSNPSVVWGRMKLAAATPAKKGAKANAPRAIDARQKEELSKLYKAFFNADDCNDDACKVNLAIAAILLDVFKVDIGSLKS